jgi:hypothetical protein
MKYANERDRIEADLLRASGAPCGDELINVCGASATIGHHAVHTAGKEVFTSQFPHIARNEYLHAILLTHGLQPRC